MKTTKPFAIERRDKLLHCITQKGRVTVDELVDKFKVSCLREFFSDYSMQDLILVYSCLDTIPGYLVHFSPMLDVWTNIQERILSKGEFLYDEVEILLREELRDPSNYMSILSAISGGTTTFNEIYTRTQLDKSMLSKYLYVLRNLGIIEKIQPVNESYKSKLKAKGALYFLKDNFFDFWFRFVYLYKQQLEEGKAGIVLESIRKECNYYLSRKFEFFIAEVIYQLNIMDISRLGRWWHRDKEIDLVALNEKTRECLFCECKWSDKIDGEKIIKVLAAKTDNVKWYNDDRKESYAVFAKSFKKRIDEYDGKSVYCFDLTDLEKAFTIGK